MPNGKEVYVMKGWVTLHRALLDHWTWKSKPFSHGQAWVDLILNANHEQSKVMIKGTLYTVERGQQCRSVLTLASEWGWSRGKTERFLITLKNEHQIEQQTDNKTSIITICNYSLYQDIRAPQEAVDRAPNDKANDTATEHQPSTNNNVTRKQGNKREKRDTPIPENFEITDEMKSWAKGAGITIDLKSATDSWKDYSASKDKRFTDWVAAWRNGMKKAQQWADEKKPKIPVTEQRMAELVELAAKSDSGVHVAEINGKIITIRSDGRVSGWQ